ncbi:META domain-containing protein [uncultured Pseudodesulfovibrio sp.]|uniref:META domain-containing protein n=1 Tax=uncultured Pseudodesulfovibrio sp. TaxID=2035858 RepID=UPI0029C90205|nr:META domain-containing protein [uncultured Pseudodesulfovibrio sp.]
MAMNWKKYCCFVSLLLVMLLAFGCSSHEDTPTMDQKTLESELVNKVWNLKNLFARDVETDTPLTLKFNADGTVEGFGGCNSFNGKYTLTGDSLSFGPMATTRKACGAALGEQEYTYLTFLATISKVKVEDEELKLFSSDQSEPMVFTFGSGGLFW